MAARRGERDDRKRAGGRGDAPAGPRASASSGRGRGPAATSQRVRTAPEAGVERVARVAERVRVELADLILRGELRDPRASGAIVSAVTITRDLSLARVFLRVLEAEASEARKREVVRAFESARGHLRHELAARLGIRSVPDLRFAWDDTTENAARLDALFAEVQADRTRTRPLAETVADEPPRDAPPAGAPGDTHEP